MSKDDFLQTKDNGKKVPTIEYYCVNIKTGDLSFQGWLNKKSDITIRRRFSDCTVKSLAGTFKWLTQKQINDGEFENIKKPLPLLKKCNQRLNTSTSYVVINGKPLEDASVFNQ